MRVSITSVTLVTKFNTEAYKREIHLHFCAQTTYKYSIVFPVLYYKYGICIVFMILSIFLYSLFIPVLVRMVSILDFFSKEPKKQQLYLKKNYIHTQQCHI